MSTAQGRAVFLDKDGTLIENVPYNVDVEQIRVLPGVREGLIRLHAAGYPLFVVSNQSGVARGYFAETALAGVEQRLREMLGEAGVPLAGFGFCPHHPEGTVAAYRVACACRKPEPGMLIELAARHGLDLARCWMVGDSSSDVEAGQRAGCRTVLIGDRDPADRVALPGHRAFRAHGMAEAAQIIVVADAAASGISRT